MIPTGCWTLAPLVEEISTTDLNRQSITIAPGRLRPGVFFILLRLIGSNRRLLTSLFVINSKDVDDLQ